MVMKTCAQNSRHLALQQSPQKPKLSGYFDYLQCWRPNPELHEHSLPLGHIPYLLLQLWWLPTQKLLQILIQQNFTYRLVRWLHRKWHLPVFKPGNLTSISGTHRKVEGKWLHKVPLTSTPVHTNLHIHHTHINFLDDNSCKLKMSNPN